VAVQKERADEAVDNLPHGLGHQWRLRLAPADQSGVSVDAYEHRLGVDRVLRAVEAVAHVVAATLADGGLRLTAQVGGLGDLDDEGGDIGDLHLDLSPAARVA